MVYYTPQPMRTFCRKAYWTETNSTDQTKGIYSILYPN